MEILYIVIPAYNEEKNIEKVIKDWYPIVEKYHGDGKSRLVIIDDGSKDDTYRLCQEYMESRPLLQAITKSNSGHGPTVLYGYNYALKKHADYIFQTDSDGQTIAKEFHPFWELRNEYDLVIGYRSKRQDGFFRLVITRTLRLVIKLFFRVDTCDANTPFRIMKAERLKEVIGLIPENFFLSNVLLTILFEKKKFKVKYIPITFRTRQGGKNSINFKSMFKVMKRIAKDYILLDKSSIKVKNE